MCTVDLNLHKLKVNKAEKDFSKLSRMDKKRERLRNRHKRDRLREKVTTGDFRVTTYFVTDRDLKMMREPFNAVYAINLLLLLTIIQRNSMKNGRKAMTITLLETGKEQKSTSKIPL